MSGRRIILVSGLAGSGTSRISEQLHRMGVPMLTTMAAPPPGTNGYLDWEDFLFVVWCGMPALMDGDCGRVLDYCKYRFERARVWGVKSPLLLPHLDLWRSMAKQLHADVQFVLSQRSFEDCQASVTEWVGMEPKARDALLDWNEKSREHWQHEQPKARLVPFGWTEFPIEPDEVKSWLT